MWSRCTVSQPIIPNSALVYSIEVCDIMAIEVKVLPVLRGIKYYSARCNITRLLNRYHRVLWVAIRDVSFLISRSFAQVCIPFAFILLWLVFVPAVFGLMVELSTVCARFFIPFVTLFCDVALRFALLAIGLLLFLFLIVLAIIVHFRFWRDMFRKWQFAFLILCLGVVSQISSAL